MHKKRQRKIKKDEDVPTEVLSQDEIDQLLTAINAGYDDPEDFRPARDVRKIKIYDFKRPDKFSKEQIRNMSILHEAFARQATFVLTNWLKAAFHVHVASVDQLTYEEFTRSIPTPTALAAIDLNETSIKNCAVMEIDPAIYFTIINKIFGGNDENIKEQHELTRIEWVVMTEIITRLLGSLREGWSKILDIRPKISHTDTNPQFINIVPPTEMIVLITLEAKIGSVEGMINIGYPHSCLENIMDKLSSVFWWGSTGQPSKNYKLLSREDVPVEIIAEVFRRDYKIGDVLKWKNEELLLPLRHRKPNTCYLRIGDRRVWYCDIIEDENWFPKKVEIIELIELPMGSEGKMDILSGANPAVAEALSGAGITVSVELGRTSKPVRDILSLGEGSIVELDKLAGEPVDIKANGVLIARGEVVVIDENFGVRVVEIVKSSEQFQTEGKNE